MHIRTQMCEAARTGPLSIRRVAARLGTSPRSLQRTLALQGLTFRELVDSVRRETALVLLVETDLPVREIARRVGYRTPSAFARAVARWVGCAPQNYRHKGHNGHSDHRGRRGHRSAGRDHRQPGSSGGRETSDADPSD